MILREEADEIAREYVKGQSLPECPFALVENATMERPLGWVYFFNSEEYLRTGNTLSKLAGNGPIYISRATGELARLSTRGSLLALIEEHEKGLKL